MSENDKKDAIQYDKASQTPKIELEGAVEIRKKSLGRRFAETFIGDDIESVKEYVKRDVVIPALKNLIFESVKSGLEMMLWRDTGQPIKRKGEPVDYNGYSSKSKSYNVSIASDRSPRDRFDFYDIIFKSKFDAEKVLRLLYEYIDTYGHATVADYYNSVPQEVLKNAGIMSSVYTDNDWGWRDLNNIRIQPVRGGYILTLPRPIYKPQE